MAKKQTPFEKIQTLLVQAGAKLAYKTDIPAEYKSEKKFTFAKRILCYNINAHSVILEKREFGAVEVFRPVDQFTNTYDSAEAYIRELIGEKSPKKKPRLKIHSLKRFKKNKTA